MITRLTALTVDNVAYRFTKHLTSIDMILHLMKFLDKASPGFRFEQLVKRTQNNGNCR